MKLKNSGKNLKQKSFKSNKNWDRSRRVLWSITKAARISQIKRDIESTMDQAPRRRSGGMRYQLPRNMTQLLTEIQKMLKFKIQKTLYLMYPGIHVLDQILREIKS